MDKFTEKFAMIGSWCSQNKYLAAITHAFQIYMPATIAGAISVLWCNVLVNNNVVNGSNQGLGAIFKPIMVLQPINAVFEAIQFATLSCISVGIVILVAQEIGESNGETGIFPGVMGLMSWIVVTPTVHTLSEFVNTKGEIATFNGLDSSYLSATGLFTSLIVGIVALEIYNFFRKQKRLKVTMPPQVPTGVARSFEVLIPTFLTLLTVSFIGWGLKSITGQYVNDIIKTLIQSPLQSIIGNNLFAVIVLQIIVALFWLVGMHGENMTQAVRDPIFKTLLYTNMATFQKGGASADDYYIINSAMTGMFTAMGGTGITIALVVAIMLFGKRDDNRSIAKLSIAPSLFNINETVTFGIPLVLNPILAVPFVLAPCVGLIVGYVLMTLHICPPAVLEVPWTTPPLLYGFLATGGQIMGAVSQLIVFVLAIIIYAPFIIFYEKYQQKSIDA